MPSPPGTTSARTRSPLACLVIALAGAAAYGNSLGGAFLFDDIRSIVQNDNIQSLHPISRVLWQDQTVAISGRPVVSLSLALNFAIGGLNVRGYHLVNIFIHILVAWTLFGIIRRTLLRPPHTPRFADAATSLAFVTALFWVVHPLCTECVTYIHVRTESSMALFYLLTLYCFIRAVESSHPGRWFVASILACAVGMGCKEAMVTAPLAVLLYDRLFVAGSWSAALRRHWPLYVGLASTWGVLAFWIATAGRLESERPNFTIEIIWRYLLTQSEVLTHYLRLALWPNPLLLDYHGWPLATGLRAVWPQALLIASLLVATVWGMVRGNPAAYAGAFCFLVLAPTSSFLPMLTEIAAERRMYLPLAALLALIVPAAFMLIHRFAEDFNVPIRTRSAATMVVVLFLASLLAGLTIHRNRDYESEYVMWTDVLAKNPNNPRAHSAFGTALQNLNRHTEAIGHYQRAIELDPRTARYPYNLGLAFQRLGQHERAVTAYRAAVALDPDSFATWYNMGNALASLGRDEEAVPAYRRAIEADPDDYRAHQNVANVLVRLSRFSEAAGEYRRVLSLKPKYEKAMRGLETCERELSRQP